MERKLATIQIIKSLEPIEGADLIELAKFENVEWQCVTGKNQFKIGDKCVYFEIDSILPFENKTFDFMGKYKYRIKTIRLKKQLSQGLIMPLSDFNLREDLPEGHDLTRALGITKYEVQIPECLRGKIVSNFPVSIVPKTDEPRIQNFKSLLVKYENEDFYVTYKMDGSSATFYYKDGHFGICSRNFEIDASDEKNAFVRIAKELDIEYRLKNISEVMGKNIAIQGELCGPGIQKNRAGLEKLSLFIYNIWNIDQKQYLNYYDMINVCKLLEIETVPIYCDYFKLRGQTVESLLEMVDKNLPIGNQSKTEGMVFRPMKEIYDEEILKDRLSFKVINNNYLLKHGE